MIFFNTKQEKRTRSVLSGRLNSATFFALIISNVTSLLLAALLSHSLLGGGLGYFAALREQTHINISYAATTVDEVHWTILGQTAVTFDWRGTENTISYGTAPGNYINTLSAVNPAAPNIPFSSAGPFWEAWLTGLSEDTLYYYKIGANSEKTFRTPIPRGTSNFSIMAEADIGDHTSYANVTVVQGQIASDPPAFVLVPGDLTYANSHGQSHADIAFNDVMVWSQVAAYMPAWGNHEWDSSADDLRNYKGRFDLPNQQTSPGSPSVSCCGEDWYWFDYGNVRFIAYPEPWSGAWSDWNTRARVLMDAAQADPAITFIVTYGHRPAYSSGHHSGSSTLKGYLDALGTGHSKYVLNLNGHSHNYERTFPQSGVVHLTVGTGGSSLEQDAGGSACSNIWNVCPAPAYTAARFMRQGVTKLTFTPTGISGQFLCGPSGGGTNDISCTVGQAIDSFTIASSGGASDATPPAVSITAPVSGDTVSSTITVTANASDNIGVVGVQFKFDGVNLGSEDAVSPYAVSLDTTTAVNGSHTLSASARDAAGNSASASAVTVTVSNVIPAALITDPTLVFSVPQVPKPGYLAPITDPTFGTRITRIANDPSTTLAWAGPPSGSGTWGSDARQHYSKDQPWSSDGSLIVLQNSVSPSVVYLDGETYQPKYGKCSNYSIGDDRWHPSIAHPHERINVSGTRLEWFDVTTCAQTRVWTLPFSVNYFGSGEGNPSFDGRYAALADATRMFVVDMDPQSPLASYASGNRRVGPSIDISNCGLSDCSVDWVSISPSGKYAVVSYNGDHPRVFDINTVTLALTARALPVAAKECSGHSASAGYFYDLGHADMTLNPFDNNEDVIVGQRRSWCDSTVTVDDSGKPIGGVMMVRLSDGRITSLTNPTNEVQAHHISTRSFDRLGWAYVGYYQGNGKRFNDEIIAVKLDGSGANNTVGSVERLAHKHSTFSGCYRCESHPVPSRDGLRVLWASNWAENCGTLCGSTSDIKAYVADSRPLRSAIITDTTPPVRSNGSPGGTLAAGTTQTTMSLTTDESATCKYANQAGVAYASMPATFTTTGSTSHRTLVTGLSNGTSYTFYVRCQDAAAIPNVNTTDYSISFAIGASAGAGGSTLTFGPTDDTYVRSDSVTSVSGGTATILNVDGSPVRDVLLKFVVSGVGSNTVSSAKLRLHVDSDASNGGGGSFYRVANNSWSETTANWNNAPVADATPLASLGPVAANTWYEITLPSFITGDGTYNIRAKLTSSDGLTYTSKEGSTSLAPQLVVTIAAVSQPSDTSAPTNVGNASPTNGTTGVATSPTLTALTASDATLPVEYYFELYTGASCNGTLIQTRNFFTSTTWNPNTLANSTSYAWRVRARDSVIPAHESAFGLCTSFTTAAPADVTPPVRSGGSPSGDLPAGTTGAIISVATDENATCKYGATAGTSYASLPTAFTTTGGTVHSSSVSGLSDGMTYTYYIRCQDSQGNTNANDYTVTFQVLTSVPVTVDTTPPLIYNIQSTDITQQSATILWDTDESATSFVQFGTTTGYGTTSSTPGLAASHSKQLTNLTSGTLYHFKVTSADAANNSATSLDQTFSTSASGAQCTESWSCSDWGSCTGGMQTRTCTDANSCGTTASRPVTSQSCSVSSPSGGGGSPSTGSGSSSGGGGGVLPTPSGSNPPVTTPGITQTPASSGGLCTSGRDQSVINAFIAQERSLVRAQNISLRNRLLGYILLQVESHGEAWYLDIVSKARYYLADGCSAYQGLRRFGLGITDADLEKIPVGIESRFADIDSDGDGLPDKMEEGLGTDPAEPDTDEDGFTDGEEVLAGYSPKGPGRLPVNQALVQRLKGRILLQVQAKGQAWYVNLKDGKRYYMKNGEAAYQIMRFLSLGVTNADLRKIEMGEME